MELVYKAGARGFVVEWLQGALGVTADGVFGKQTCGAVERLQAAHGLTVTGAAGEREFVAAGLRWPSEFERAMNVVCGFEGTSFGDCNSRDIDGAGLTLGIAGFTTKHGEVQELLASYLARRPESLKCLGAGAQRSLLELMASRGSAARWKQMFYGSDGVVKREWREAFAVWGGCRIMQKLQLEMACKRFWLPAVASAEAVGFGSARGRLFMLDVAVQNGGWRRLHHLVARRMVDWYSGDEQKALVVAARAVAACAKEEWRNDVLSRKMAIATGRGVVHGRVWEVECCAVGEAGEERKRKG